MFSLTFDMNLLIRADSTSNKYRIHIEIDGLAVDYIQNNAEGHMTTTSTDTGMSNHYQVVLELKNGQNLAFFDVYATASINDHTHYSCQSNGESHSCSILSGRLMKPL